MKKQQVDGDFIRHVPCGDCGSKDNLHIYLKVAEDGTEYVDGFCPTCENSYKSPKKMELMGHSIGDVPEWRKSKDEEMLVSDEDMEKVLEILELPSKGMAARRIKTKTTSFYGVKANVGADDKPTDFYFPSTRLGELVGYKKKPLDKVHGKYKYQVTGSYKSSDELFGQHLFTKGGKYLVITTGQEDAMAFFEALKEGSKAGYETPCVSLNNGDKSAVKQVQANYKFISSFEKVVLAFDNDPTAQAAAMEVSRMLSPGKACIAHMSEFKDACEYKKRGKDRKLIDIFYKAEVKKPSQVVTVDDIFEKALKSPELGLSLPWESATKATLGLRRGEIHIIGAAPKIGKTEHQHQMIKHMTEVHGEVVGVMSLEENPVKTLKKVAGKYAGKQFTKPPEIGGYTQEELVEHVTNLKGKIEFYSSEGVRDADEILETIRYWASKGIWFFIIDPLTALVAEHDSSAANDILNNFMSKAASMCMELQITMFMYSHVNPVKTGLPHDKGGDVLSSQFTGSRALEKWAHYGWGIQRDRSEPDKTIRNTARVSLLFDREYGEWCEYFAFYNSETNDWSEVPDPDSLDEDSDELAAEFSN